MKVKGGSNPSSGTEVYSSNILYSGYNQTGWTEYTLPTPIDLAKGFDYWLVTTVGWTGTEALRCFDGGSGKGNTINI